MSRPPAVPLLRGFELALLGLGLAGWLVTFLYGMGWEPQPGALDLGLYPFFAIAAGLGFLSGAYFAWRRPAVSQALLPRLFFVWFLVPPGLLTGLRAMAPAAVQEAAPMAEIWSFGVFAVLFLATALLVRRAAERR